MIATSRESAQPVLLVTSEAAAEMLAISIQTLRRITAPNGDLPAVRIGNGRRPLLRYSVADLERWIEQQRLETRPDLENGQHLASIVEKSSGHGALETF